MSTSADVAKWMLEEVTARRRLLQERAASRIRREFGEDFVYRNKNGNVAISPSVLKEFRKISEDTVVWERRERCWRLRLSRDIAGKRQSE